MPKWYSYCVIWGHRMTTDKKVVRQLQLAKELNCVSREHKSIGYSRQQCGGLIIPDTILGGTVATMT
ncbi:MAG: hypothetical protein ACRC38_01240 [Plesiomonas sp.]